MKHALQPGARAGMQPAPQELKLSPSRSDGVSRAEHGTELEWRGVDARVVKVIACNKLVSVRRVVVRM